MRRSERRTSCNLHVSVNTAIPIICVEPLFVFWSSEKPSMKLQYWYKAYFSYDPILKPQVWLQVFGLKLREEIVYCTSFNSTYIHQLLFYNGILIRQLINGRLYLNLHFSRNLETAGLSIIKFHEVGPMQLKRGA